MSILNQLAFLDPTALSLPGQACLAAGLVVSAAALVAVLRRRMAGGAPSLNLADSHIMNRLNALADRADDERFDATTKWIRAQHGAEMLEWMRERAEAEGRTQLAARLARS